MLQGVISRQVKPPLATAGLVLREFLFCPLVIVGLELNGWDPAGARGLGLEVVFRAIAWASLLSLPLEFFLLIVPLASFGVPRAVLYRAVCQNKHNEQSQSSFCLVVEKNSELSDCRCDFGLGW